MHRKRLNRFALILRERISESSVRVIFILTMKHLLTFFLGVAVVLADDFGEQCEIVAPTGSIRGSTLTSRLGRKIYSFRGIRYGEPPIGQQRFQVNGLNDYAIV